MFSWVTSKTSCISLEVYGIKSESQYISGCSRKMGPTKFSADPVTSKEGCLLSVGLPGTERVNLSLPAWLLDSAVPTNNIEKRMYYLSFWI